MSRQVLNQVRAARILFEESLLRIETSATGHLEAVALNAVDGDNDAADDAKIEFDSARDAADTALDFALQLENLVRDNL